MAAKEFDSEVKVPIMISGLNHCGNGCKYLCNYNKGKRIRGEPGACCNLYGGQLTLDPKRKNHPWKRCKQCKDKDCSGLIGHKRYPKCPECGGTSFVHGRVCTACDGCGEKRN